MNGRGFAARRGEVGAAACPNRDSAGSSRALALALLSLGAFASAAGADVGVSVATSNATPVAGGAAFSYTITLTNNDAGNPASGVVMVDPLPAGVILANNNLTIGGSGAGATNCTGPALQTNGEIVCETTSIPAGGNVTVQLVVQIVPNVASGVRTNTARVTAGGVANSASVQINIQVNAPLSINKTGPASAARGSLVTYQITVNNGGSSTAINASISDPLPANTSFVAFFGAEAFTDSCSFSPAANALTCAGVDLPSGQHRLTLVVRLSEAAPLGSFGNTATITNAGTGTIAVGSSTANVNVTP